MDGYQSYQKDTEHIQDGVNGFKNNVAYTSSNSYPDFTAQHNTFASGSQSRHPMNLDQWPTMPPHNSLPQYQHPQHPNQWSGQMQQPFPNAMNGMNHLINGMPNMNMNMNIPAFNMTMFPQVLQDALALSAPVVPADERLLVSTLVEARSQKENYKNALNGLHGRNGHSASLWKDYYLEHRDRLDTHVSQALKARGIEEPVLALKAVKKPTIDAFKPEASSPAASPVPRKPKKASSKASKASTPSLPISKTTERKRSTINSLTVHTPSFNKQLPPPNSEIKIPDPPSRSPSPPTKVVPHSGRGNRFTDEDKAYFIKFLLWRLKHDASLTRNDLCDQLAEKAPHHTSQSWYSYWSNNHDLPDKILAAAHGEESEEESEDESEDSGSEEEHIVNRRRSKYKESSSEDESEGEDADADADSHHASDEETNNIKMTMFDERAMGSSGEQFTDADMAIMARYVASFPDFAAATFAQKWVPWGERYPQRSAKSWAEHYRRNERNVNSLARRIKKAGLAQGLVKKEPSSTPQPDRSNSVRLQSSLSDVSGPPKAKRKFVADDENDAGNRSKVGRVDNMP